MAKAKLTKLVLILSLSAACGAVESRSSAGLPPDGGFLAWPDAGSLSCRGNNDGIIVRDEVLFAPGVELRYRMNLPGTVVSVDVRGVPLGDGRYRWDFSDPAGELYPLTLLSTKGTWFESYFPGAKYAARLDPRSSLLGLYRVTDSQVDLLGVAGETPDAGTRLPYDGGVPLLKFPLSHGASWTAEATVINGEQNHIPFASRDRYEIAIDATGEVRLAMLTFVRTLRLRIELIQQFPAGPGTRRIQYLWLTECYGEVARVTSRDGEVDPNFAQAVEFRRLGW